ncbi:endonuclease/exonuclease/phosphatase family protein [Nocardioides halotolerans]|uniref:endonuclease/exonuclease/phosphatase family protein n=1 Tax=Nocardioides halotolerans TaxID=433660 RepID=UPI00316AD7A2
MEKRKTLLLRVVGPDHVRARRLHCRLLGVKACEPEQLLLTEVMKGTETPVLVLGDLNDGQHSNTINILTEQPNYLVGESQGGADIGLYTAQTLQEYRDTRDVYYTHVHQDLRESLDHVLVSEQFYDHSRRRQWLFDGLGISNDHLNDDDHRATGTGDHGVVKVGFRWKPFAG